MSDRIIIKNATPAAVLFVAERLRAADRQELETATGLSHLESVFRAWGWSEVSWVAEIDGLPAIIFGVCEGGVVWLVGTDAISTAALPVFRTSKVAVKQLLKMYPTLHNAADCRNTLHIRWLKTMGFTFDEVVDINGHPFQRFHMNRKEIAPCATQ